MKMFLALIIITIIGIAGCEFITGNDSNESTSPVNFAAKKSSNMKYGLVPVNAIEVISKRTKYAKIFNNGDGTFTAVVYTNPIHEKDENNKWQDIDNSVRAYKMALDFVDNASLRGNPEYDGSQYYQMCVDWKLGYENGWTSRLLPEFNLTAADTSLTITSVTDAHVYFTAERPYTDRSVGLCVPIGDQPTETSDETNYSNCSSPITYIDIVDEDETDITLNSSERTRIKDRINNKNYWYSVGYQLDDESEPRVLIHQNKLEFVYTGI